MAVEIIKVRKKSNHALTRSIKSNALSIFEKRGWEAIPGQTISAPVEVKKKEDAKPAEDPESDFINKGDPGMFQPEGVSDDPFSQINDAETSEKSLDTLREKYEKASGKAADKRWKEERLNDEISKLTADGN